MTEYKCKCYNKLEQVVNKSDESLVARELGTQEILASTLVARSYCNGGSYGLLCMLQTIKQGPCCRRKSSTTQEPTGDP
jgi:hypothetical protein